MSRGKQIQEKPGQRIGRAGAWRRVSRGLGVLGGMLFLVQPAVRADRQLGDIDNNGVFNVLDLAKQIALARGQAGAASAADAVYADVDGNGFVNDADSAALVRFILETDTPETLPLASIRETSPAAGETRVAVTREFVLHFSIPLALDAVVTTHNPNTGTSGNLFATFGGQRLLTRAELSSDRKKASLFFLEPLPAGARVRVTFDSTGLRDILGRDLDGDADGLAGGSAYFNFDTLSITGLTGTGVVGRVYGVDVGTGGGTSNPVPLAGVTITVDGAEQDLRTTTAADGTFTLTPAPAGKFFVLIDGRTASGGGAGGGYYAFVGKAWDGVAGRLDTPATPATDVTAAGDIYLPFIPTGTLQTVSSSQPTPITFAPSVLMANPELSGVEITVPANSLFADSGARGGQVGIAPVAPERLPEPLPPGLDLPLVITIQTDGATNFDQPVPVRFPNLPDPVTGLKPSPGAKTALFSFDHDTGRWEIAGPMTVTADGNFVETDAGVGVRQPGWHGSGSGAGGSGGGAGSGGGGSGSGSGSGSGGGGDGTGGGSGDGDGGGGGDGDGDGDGGDGSGGGGDNGEGDDGGPGDGDDDGGDDNPNPDIDGDGIPNDQDSDMDGDGFDNGEDIDKDGDGISNSTDDDMDGDGLDNDDDPDQDGDGIPNDEDPYYGDGFPDDPDVDGDGVPNPSDIDIDGDGVPNDQDNDSDGDGVVNSQDVNPCAGGSAVTIAPGVTVAPSGVAALKQVLALACLHQATISSGKRTTTEQAALMFSMCETSGPVFAKTQFSAAGDQVIDVYIARKAAGDSNAQIQAAMRQRIIDLGSTSVSAHCSDTREIFDVAPVSILDKPKFEQALALAKAGGIIADFKVPPAEPGYHLEVGP